MMSSDEAKWMEWNAEVAKLVKELAPQHGGKEATSKRLTTSRFSATLPQVDLEWLLTEVAFLSV